MTLDTLQNIKSAWYDPQLPSGSPVVIQNVNYVGGDDNSVFRTMNRLIQDMDKRRMFNAVRQGFSVTINVSDTIDISSGYATIAGRWVVNDATLTLTTADRTSTDAGNEYYVVIEVTEGSETSSRNPLNDSFAGELQPVTGFSMTHDKIVLAKVTESGDGTDVFTLTEDYSNEGEITAAVISPPSSLPSGSSFSEILFRTGQYERTDVAKFSGSTFQLFDDNSLIFGTDSDYSLKFDSVSSEFQLTGGALYNPVDNSGYYTGDNDQARFSFHTSDGTARISSNGDVVLDFDTNGTTTQYFRVTTNNLGTELLRLDQSGNIGFNTTDIENWGGGMNAIDGFGASIAWHNTDQYLRFVSNVFYDSADNRWEFRDVDSNGEHGSLVEQINDMWKFQYTTDGTRTANSPATLVNGLIFDGDGGGSPTFDVFNSTETGTMVIYGSLGIGANTPSRPFVIRTSDVVAMDITVTAGNQAYMDIENTNNGNTSRWGVYSATEIGFGYGSGKGITLDSNQIAKFYGDLDLNGNSILTDQTGDTLFFDSGALVADHSITGSDGYHTGFKVRGNAFDGADHEVEFFWNLRAQDPETSANGFGTELHLANNTDATSIKALEVYWANGNDPVLELTNADLDLNGSRIVDQIKMQLDNGLQIEDDGNSAAKMLWNYSPGTDATDWRLYIAPRNTTDTGWNFNAEFGWNQSEQQWYVDKGLQIDLGNLDLNGNDIVDIGNLNADSGTFSSSQGSNKVVEIDNLTGGISSLTKILRVGASNISDSDLDGIGDTTNLRYIEFFAQAGVQGDISSNAAGNVSYNGFTGSHRTKLLNEEEKTKLEIGMILESTGKEFKEFEYNSRIYVNISKIRKSPSVFGVYMGGESEFNDDTYIHSSSIGDGKILVTDTNGNIKNGDYIQSSPVSGLGEKQDESQLHNYTVAKALIDVDFDDIKPDDKGIKKKLIPCTYHCG